MRWIARPFGLLLLFLCTQAWAQIAVQGLAVHEDRAGTATIADIATLPDDRFSPRPSGLSAGYTHSVHWLRFSVQAPAGKAGQWWLEIHPTYLNDLRLYEPDPLHPGTFRERLAGDMLPFAAREAPYRGFLFRLDLKEGEARILHLRIQTTSSSIAMLKLWPVERFSAGVPLEYVLQGVYFGLLVIILLINTLYWIGLREPLYLYYTAWLAASFIHALLVQGLGSQFLLPDHPQLVNSLQGYANLILAASAGRLYQTLLMVERRQAVLWWLYRTLTFGPLLLMPLLPLGYFTEVQRIVTGYSAFMSLVAMVRSVQLLRQGIAGGTLLVTATLMSAVAIAFFTGQGSGLFPGNFIVLHAFQIGTFFNIVALHLAISARARTQKKHLQEAQAKARHSELKAERELRAREEQANFISMIAHEIRSPLAGIGAAVESIEILLGKISPELALRIDRIRRAAQRIGGIADRYLQMDRADNARLTPHLAEHGLHEIVQLAVAQFAGAKDRLRLHLGDDIRLRCDAGLVATAILNLVDNAMKYSPADEPVDLTVAVFRDRRAAIDIADRGPGVPAELHHTIFERYFRLPEHSDEPGIGVGLALTRQIAELHDGSVEVHDRDNGGAVFRLLLPLSPGEASVSN